MKKIALVLGLSFGLVLNAYAINVNVKTSSENVEALGFTVKGKKHGGLGKSYEGSDLTSGMYRFGVRSNGKDIPCLVNGKKGVKLTTNTTATLILNGKGCKAEVNQG